ncbi:MAG TPA: choice-of-anchor Q domain-containing protein [Humisphaera sp.]
MPLLPERLEPRRLFATYVVTGLADAAGTVTGTGPATFAATTLRAAINAANARAGADAITFAAGARGTIQLDEALPTLTGQVAVDGPGAGALTVRRKASADTDFSIFRVAPTATAAINGLTVSGGTGTGAPLYDYASALQGGGIFNEGTLSVRDCTFAGNSRRPPDDGTEGVVLAGGAIASTGTLRVAGCHFTDNRALYDGGAVAVVGGTLDLADSSFRSNRCDSGGSCVDVPVGTAATIASCSFADSVGRAIDNDGTTTLSGSTVRKTFSSGGAILNDGRMTIVGCAIGENSAGDWYSDASGTSVWNRPDGQLKLIDTVLYGDADPRGWTIDNDGTLGAANCRIRDSSNGGVVNTGSFTGDRLVVSGNRSGGNGGGVLNLGTLALSASTIAGNAAKHGAGICNNRGTVTLTGCTISGNHTLPFGDGGGVWNDRGTVRLFNCTVAGNTAAKGGGGVWTHSGTLRIVQSTLVRNRALAGGGVYNSGAARLDNSILALNTDLLGEPDDVTGALSVASGFNLVGTGKAGGLKTGVRGNRVGVTAAQLKLTPLASNGGPTRTIALLAGSVAINVGSNALSVDAAGKPLVGDQRGAGFPRIVGGRVDVGAFERQASN